MAKIIVRSKKAAKPSASIVKSPGKVSATKSNRAGTQKQSSNPTGKNYELTGLSLKGLIRATPPLMKNNAHDVVVKQLKLVKTKGGFPAVRAKAVDASQGSKRRIHDCNIVGKEKDQPIGKQKHVLCSCDCENFCYYWEYALTHWGSSTIKFSNGEAPDVTNPSLHPGLCKHLVALGRVVIEHGF